MKNTQEIAKNTTAQMMKAWDWTKAMTGKAEGKCEGAYEQVKAGVAAAKAERKVEVDKK